MLERGRGAASALAPRRLRHRLLRPRRAFGHLPRPDGRDPAPGGGGGPRGGEEDPRGGEGIAWMPPNGPAPRSTPPTQPIPIARATGERRSSPTPTRWRNGCSG